jgi:hypothetical protein
MIKQKDDFGCAPACVANKLNISYDSALGLFSDPHRAKLLGYYCRDIVDALANSGVESEYKYIKPRLRKEIYKLGAIVFVGRSKKYPAGHYLLRTDGGWADPWINFPQKPRLAGLRKKLPSSPIYLIRLK